MEITLKRNHGYELIIVADNVRITEDIEQRTYPKDENGKSIISLNPQRDIKTDAIQQFVDVLSDMMYYREAEFHSVDLIKALFNKLPKEEAIKLAERLSSEYNNIEE